MHCLFFGQHCNVKAINPICPDPDESSLLVLQELFGPLSMRALEDDKYVRQTDGYLPKANVAFVDEIFKANSAILNTLLTVLNERLFDNGTSREQVPLLCLVGVSHSCYHRKGLKTYSEVSFQNLSPCL